MTTSRLVLSFESTGIILVLFGVHPPKTSQDKDRPQAFWCSAGFENNKMLFGAQAVAVMSLGVLNQGFIGPYHPSNGTVRADPAIGLANGTGMWDAFHWGE